MARSGGGGGGPAWRTALLLPLAWLACAGATKYVAPRATDGSGVMLPMDACLWAPASAADLDAPQGNCGRGAAAYYCTIIGAHAVDFKLAPTNGTTVHTTEQDLDRQLCAQNCTTFEYIECSDAPAAGVPGLCERRPGLLRSAAAALAVACDGPHRLRLAKCLTRSPPLSHCCRRGCDLC